MTRTRAVFLDVGGTLLEMGDPAAAYLDILREHGHEVSLEQVQGWLAEARQDMRTLPTGPAPDFSISPEQERARREAMVAAFLRRAGVEERFDACRLAIWESWLGTRVFRIFPETVSFMAQLKREGYIVGAVSNWEPRLSQLCANHAIADYFDFILASEAEGHAKPGTRLFEVALERAGVDPAEAIHIGDSPREDVETPESLGIRAIMIRRAEGSVRHSPSVPSLRAALPLIRANAWLRGTVASGKREAAGFTRLPWVEQQVKERLGFELYPGTLNLELDASGDLATWSELRQRTGVPIEPSPGFCAAVCFKVSVEGQHPGAIVLPMVEGYPSHVLEILAPVQLRSALGLEDGSRLTLAVLGLET